MNLVAKLLFKLQFLDKMRTFSLMLGPHRKISGSTSFKTTVLPDLLEKKNGHFLLYGDLFLNLVVQFLFKLQFCRPFRYRKMRTLSLMWGHHREFSGPASFEITGPFRW